MKRAALAAVATALVVSACSADAQPTATSCPFVSDGTCDEPLNCALGTDDADCTAVCAQNPDLAPIACAFRGAEVPPSLPAPSPAQNGSNGSGGAIGVIDGDIAANGPSNNTITRHYRLYVPDRYDPSQPTPVVFIMGGFRLSVYTLEAYTEMDRTADQNGFIAAYLEADWRDFGAASGGWVWGWYVYANAPDAEWEPVGDWSADPDVDFVRKLAAQLQGQYNVDVTRMYASGHSRGAAESIILAYELPNLIAGYDCESGFADVNGFEAVMSSYAGPNIPAVIVHGKIDDDVPFASGQAIANTLMNKGYVEGQDFLFFALDGVPHRWQSWLNQQMWDFLSSNPMPFSMVQKP